MTLLAIILAGVLLALYLARNKFRRSDTNLYDVESVLAEVDIYLSYGRRKQAISLLERALEVHQGNEQLASKLHKVKPGNS